HPGHYACDDPGQQRQRFLEEAALEADQTGNGDDGDNRPIDPSECHDAAYRRERRRILTEPATPGKQGLPYGRNRACSSLVGGLLLGKTSSGAAVSNAETAP